MTKSEVQCFREFLQAKEHELSQDLKSVREEIAIEAGADPLDAMRQAAERDFAIRKLDRTSRLLAEIRAALHRLDQDRFGICLRCEEVISLRRLLAVPWAPLCLPCQELADQAPSPEPLVSPLTNAA